MAKKVSSSSPLGDFLTFRTMITPVIIQLLCWIGVLGSIAAGIYMIVRADQAVNSDQQMIEGIVTLLLGPLAVRVYCEMLILFFRMNQTLTEIKNKR